MAENMAQMEIVFTKTTVKWSMGALPMTDNTYKVVGVQGAKITVDSTPRQQMEGFVFVPTREEYVVLDKNTIMVTNPQDSRHLTFKRVQ